MSDRRKKQLKKIKPRNWVVPLMRQTRKSVPLKIRTLGVFAGTTGQPSIELSKDCPYPSMRARTMQKRNNRTLSSSFAITTTWTP